MKLGFVVHFFDFRNDVRSIIKKIAEKSDVVLFVNKDHFKLLNSHKPNNVEIRIIDERKKSRWNRLVEIIYRFFKKIPKSRNNFFLMECFKISKIKNSSKRNFTFFMLKLTMILPKFISYDWLLDNLKFKSNTKIDDINKMFFFTEISNDYFLARCIRKKLESFVYVYSWDHPYKHTKFSNKLVYLTWSNSTKDDLIFNMKISKDNIRILGSTQFCYVHKALEHNFKKKSYNFSYIYYACAIGINDLVEQEIEIIKTLNKIIKDHNSNLKLIVRPYPILDNWNFYNSLKLDGIILDDSFRRSDLSVSNDSILEKFEKIKNSELFLHLGSTIGLEASFFETPSVIIDFGYNKNSKKNLSIKNFIHQGQNDKYLFKEKSINYFSEELHFKNWLDDYSNNLIYKQSNKYISSDFDIHSFDEISKRIEQLC